MRRRVFLRKSLGSSRPKRSDVRVAFNARAHATAQASALYPCVPTPTKAWSRTPTKAEQVVGKIGLKRLQVRGFEVRLPEMLVHVGPKTKEALGVLLDNCHQEGYNARVGLPCNLEVLANATGRETMPAPHLLNIVSAVRASRDSQQVASDPKEAFSLSELKYMGEKGAKASLLDLAVVADDTMIGAVMNFAEKVASVYDVSDLTPIEVDKLAAETGPGTMPASQLLALMLEIPKVVIDHAGVHPNLNGVKTPLK